MTAPVKWDDVPMLTRGMKNLGNQINAWAPDRDGTSDGAIGDYAHTQEKSDHNPDDTSAHNAGWDGDADNTKDVRAIDVDIDFHLPGVTAQILVDHIRKLPNLKSVLRYIIYNRKMYHERDDFEPTAYTGASAHTEHIHFSGAYVESADQDHTFNYHLEDIPVSLTAADKTWLIDQINAAYKDTNTVSGHSETVVGNRVLSQDIPDGTQEGTPQTPAYKVIENVGLAVKDIKNAIAGIENTLEEILHDETPNG